MRSCSNAGSWISFIFVRVRFVHLRLFVCLSVCLSVHLFVCLCVCLYFCVLLQASQSYALWQDRVDRRRAAAIVRRVCDQKLFRVRCSGEQRDVSWQLL